MVWSKSSSTSVEEVGEGSNPFLAWLETCNYSYQCKTPNISFSNLLFSSLFFTLGVTFSCIQCAVILCFSLYSSWILSVVPDHKYFWVEHLVLICAPEMLLSAVFYFSPKWYFSSCVCPEQLVSWSIPEATKDPFENKDFKTHVSDFPELGAVAGEVVCSPAVHTGTRGSVQGQVGWSSEQPGLVKDVPAHGRGVGTRWSLRSLPTLTILWL